MPLGLSGISRVFNETKHRADNPAPVLKALTTSLWTRPWRESWRGAAPAGELVQQVDEKVDSFQKGSVPVSRCSQKLGVNLLVGSEGSIFFDVIAWLKKRNRKREVT